MVLVRSSKNDYEEYAVVCSSTYAGPSPRDRSFGRPGRVMQFSSSG